MTTIPAGRVEAAPGSPAEGWCGVRLTACGWCGSRGHVLDELRGQVHDHCLRCGAEHARVLVTEPASGGLVAAGTRRTRWVAHAGLAADRPGGAPTHETLAEAVGAGVDCLELDVCVTREGILVLRHDARLRTGRRRRLAALTLDELRSRGHRLLTLDDAADLVGDRVHLLVDVKGREVTGPLARWLCQRRDVEVLGVCSDDREVLGELRRRAPRIPRWWSLPVIPTSSTQWARTVLEVLVQRGGLHGLAPPMADIRALVRDRPWCREDLLHLAAIPTRRRLPAQLPRLTDEVGAAGVAVAHGAITPALCAAAERMRLLLAAWTVNRVGLAREVMRCGVQIIISDRVVPLRRALAPPVV